MRPAIDLLRQSALVLAATLAWGPAIAAPASLPAQLPGGASPCSRGVEMGPLVKLAVGKAMLLKLEAPIARILLGNPENSQAAQPRSSVQNQVVVNVGRDDRQVSAAASPAAGAPAAGQGGGGGGGQQNARRPGVADVDVLLLSPREVYLLGKTIGSTNIAMLDRAGRCTLLDVSVGMDTAAVTASLKELLPQEGQIVVSSAADSLVLSGIVSDAAAADRALDIAGAYVRKVTGGLQGGRAATHDQIVNMLAVAAPQQVMLEVKVAEISKALLDQFGINFARAYSPSDGSMIRFISGLFGGAGLLASQIGNPVVGSVGLGVVGSMTNGAFSSATTLPAGDVSIGGGTTDFPIAAGKNATSLAIDAQKQDGLVKILAEPTVMAISGQEGSFLAGGTIFIPVAQGNSNSGSGLITLEEKQFGVSLKFTPTVLGDGRINLKVNPEVSELSPQGVTITSTNSGGTQILPAFSVRRATTTVQLMDGQSFAIGGLIKNNVVTSITAFPFLGELPVIGALFRSSSFRNDRSELVFVITPRLVRPLPPNYALPTDNYIAPTRNDILINGRLEGQPPAPAASEAATQALPAPAETSAAPANGGFEVK